MSNATNSKVSYTDEETFAWVMGEKGPQPVIWNNDFALPYTKNRTVLFSKKISQEDKGLSLDKLAELYPCPETV